jgi:hypothetical protein
VYFVADGFFALQFFSSFGVRYVGPTPVMEGDWNLLYISFVVTAVAIVDAIYAASAHNKKFFVKCPRCRANNDRGLPQCLVCWAPLPAAAAPPVAGPVPPPR